MQANTSPVSPKVHSVSPKTQSPKTQSPKTQTKKATSPPNKRKTIKLTMGELAAASSRAAQSKAEAKAEEKAAKAAAKAEEKAAKAAAKTAKAAAKTAKAEEKAAKAVAKAQEKTAAKEETARIKALALQEKAEARAAISAAFASALSPEMEKKADKIYNILSRNETKKSKDSPKSKTEKTKVSIMEARQYAYPDMFNLYTGDIIPKIPLGNPAEFKERTTIIPGRNGIHFTFTHAPPFQEYYRKHIYRAFESPERQQNLFPASSKYHYYQNVDPYIVSIGFELEFSFVAPCTFDPDDMSIEYIYIPLNESKSVGKTYYEHCQLGEFETPIGTGNLSFHTDISESTTYSEPFFYIKRMQNGKPETLRDIAQYKVNWNLLESIDLQNIEAKECKRMGKCGGVMNMEYHSLFTRVNPEMKNKVLHGYMSTIKKMYEEFSKCVPIADGLYSTYVRKDPDTGISRKCIQGFMLEPPADSPMSTLTRVTVNGKKKTVEQVHNIKYMVPSGIINHKPQVTIGLPWDKFCEIRYIPYLSPSSLTEKVRDEMQPIVDTFPDQNDQCVCMHVLVSVSELNYNFFENIYKKASEQCRHRLTEIMDVFGFTRGSEKMEKLRGIVHTMNITNKAYFKFLTVLFSGKYIYHRGGINMIDQAYYDKNYYERYLPDLLNYLDGKKSVLGEFEKNDLSIPQPFTRESQIILYEDRAYSQKCEKNEACFFTQKAIEQNFSPLASRKQKEIEFQY